MNTSDAGWIQYFKDLRRSFGQRNAVSVWVKTWESRGGKTSKANTSTLRTFMKKQGVEVDNTGIAKIVDAGKGFANKVGFVYKTGVVFIFVSGGIILAGAALIIYGLAKQPAENLGIVSGTAARKFIGG